MGFLKSHKSTAVTSIIKDCCAENELDEDDEYIDSQIDFLLDAIRKQNDFVEPGGTEAARALRKKLKYGASKKRFNSLKILDMLVLNGANYKFMEPLFNDDKLLTILQFYLVGDFKATLANPNTQLSEHVFEELSELTFTLMQDWSIKFPDSSNLENFNLLFKRCQRGKEMKKEQKRSQHGKSRQGCSNQVPDFMNDEADMDTPFSSYDDVSDRPKTNAELDKQFKIPRINYEKETTKILQLIADANVKSTNLTNTLNSLDKDELSIHSIKANNAFDQCRSVRRKVLRYLQLVQKEEYLGPLLKSNDELVDALKKYELRSVPAGTKISNEGGGETDSDYDSLADYESDHESIIPTPTVGAKSSKYSLSSDNEEDDDSGYHEPPSSISGSSRTNTSSSTIESSIKNKKAPPPVPPKTSILRSPNVNNNTTPKLHARNPKSDYDPFSDDNEVAPSRWS